ncbi:MAG: DUF11 domain-containing protein [Thermoflexales bacterium]|nr:DUF11 domain-containing protein [Thermoflexales bacterium]
MTYKPFSKIALVLACALLGVLLAGFALARPAAQSSAESPFGYGLPVQLVDPTGRNSVQLISPGTPLTASLQLYALTPAQFISFYNSLPTYSWWNDWRADPTGLPLAAAWQETITSTALLYEARLPHLPSGFYLLSARYANGLEGELLVILSPNALVLKSAVSGGHTQVTAWASRLSSKESLAGASVKIYDQAGNLLAQGLTNAEGVYMAELSTTDPQALVAVGEREGQVIACGTRWEWGDGYWWWGSHMAAPHKVYLYTDRPIYRPGHTVYYKAILRHDDDGSYEPLTGTQPVTVTLRDPRHTVLSEAAVLPSSFGTISGSFRLADELSLGDYSLEVTLDGYSYRQAFKVEEYRKPDYAVALSTTRPYAFVGDVVSLSVNADYYFGQPVADASVELKVYKQEGYYYYGESLVWQTTGRTDAKGDWEVTFDTTGYASSDATFTFAAAVVDGSNQSVAGSLRVPLYYAEYSLEMSAGRYGYKPGETVTVSLLARDRQSAPWAGQPLTVTVMEWKDGGYQPLVHAVGTTDAAGQAQIAFKMATAGWYELQAEGYDRRGRRVTATSWFWTYSYGWNWYYNPDQQVSVSADKASYAPGDVAQLLVRSPVTGTALLSLERGRVRRQYPVVLSDTVSVLAVPIEAEFAPNVFATVSIFQRGLKPDESYYWSESTPEGKLLSGSTELVVPADERRLRVELIPDNTTYRPRDTVTFTIQVRDHAGQPAAAEVSLGLVDEAIYALSEELSAGAHQAFYARRGLAVNSYDSLHPARYYYRGWIASPTATPAGTTTPAPSAPTDGGGKGSEGVRRDFPDTAYWQPGIVTDENGRATVSLVLPDNLTRWRAVARAVTLDTRVGETATHITVTKELLVRPVLPRFLIQGDVIRLRAIAHNYLSDPLSATLKLSANNLVMLGEGCGGTTCQPAPVRLPAGGTAILDRSAVASRLGDGHVLAHLHASDLSPDPSPTRGGEQGDAVDLPLPVRPFAVSDVDSRTGMLGGSGSDPMLPVQVTETFYVSVTAIPDATHLEIKLSSSIALGLLDGLEYLIDYPYGCIEQTMGRVLPNAMVVQAFDKLGLPKDRLPEDLDEIMAAGLQKIYGMQNEDGGWGWWYDDDESLYQTAYVMYGLVMMEKAGYQVDAGVMDRGMAALQRLLVEASEPRTRAYALYVLAVAGQGDLAAAQALLADRDQLDYFAQAALALALFYDGDGAGAGQLAGGLEAAAVEFDSMAYWPQSDQDGTYSRKAMASTTRATAMALEALVKIRPAVGAMHSSPLQSKAALWLMNKRVGGHWRTTQETSYAILALVDYIQISGELAPDYRYTLYLNDRLVAQGVVSPGNALEPIPSITLGYQDLTMGAHDASFRNDVRLVKEGRGQLYYALSLYSRHLSEGFVAVQPAGKGLRVTRHYEIAGLRSPVSDFTVGDLITVHLSLDVAQDAWYVLLEDPLPAGCEALNERLNTTSYTPGVPYYFWRMYGYNRKEVHDDRVSLFMTYLPSGHYEYTYLMRAVYAGQFSVLPAQVYLMYDPDTWARSASQRVQIDMQELPRPLQLVGDFDRDCRLTDFDLRQVAAAWDKRAGEPGFDVSRDLDGDLDVDIADVLRMTANDGKLCSLGAVTWTLPIVSLPAASVVPASRAVSAGQVFTVTVALNEALTLDGYQFQLGFDPGLVRVQRMAVPAGYTPLGPHVLSQAQVSGGAFRYGGVEGLATTSLAIVTFTALQDGEVHFSLSPVQAVESAGGYRVVAPPEVFKSVAPSQDVPLGGIVTYTIQVRNASLDTPMEGLVITDRLPAHVTAITTTEGTLFLPLGNNTLAWAPLSIAADSTFTLAFTARVTDEEAAYGAAVANTAYYTSAAAGFGASNTAIFQIEPRARVYLPVVMRQ